MIKNLLLTSLVTAVAVFAFGAIFWMSPVGTMGFEQVPDSEKLMAALTEHLPGTGTYYFPDPSDQDKWAELHQRGPLGTVHLRSEGATPMAPTLMLTGFLHSLIAIFVMALAYSRIAGALSGFGQRFSFFFLVALAVAIFANLGMPIWWYQSWTYHLSYFLYDFLAWLIVGAIFAKMIKAPRPA